MITVIGATGNVGRPLVEALDAAGERVTAVSRRPAGNGHSDRVRHRQADLEQPGSLGPALEGAHALFLLAAAGDPRQVLDVARARGVRRVVVMSSQGAATRPEAPAYGYARAFEGAARESGLGWTILRPSGFDSNAFWWRDTIVGRGAVVAPFGDVGLPTVDPADIAEVAATALRDESHDGHIYELTGPAPISPRQQTLALGEALGVPVRFEEQSRDEAWEQMLRFMPPAVAESTLAVLGAPSLAEARVSPDVERVLGRPPRAFADWARRNVAAFR
jgi:uncharacterized protein YbjT (DUF2867 family)